MTDKEIVESLKQISEKLDTINNTIKEFCAKPKEPEKNEEREFQTKLAKLQADVQILLTACFTLIVLMATTALGAWQIESTPTANLPLPLASVRDPIFYLFAIVALVCGIGTLYSFRKMQSHRNDMEKL